MLRDKSNKKICKTCTMKITLRPYPVINPIDRSISPRQMLSLFQLPYCLLTPHPPIREQSVPMKSSALLKWGKGKNNYH